MKVFVTHTGFVAPLERPNVDTDQIVPKQFLKWVERSGFGKVLFYDWRYKPDGTPLPDSPWNTSRYSQASILVAGRNFGSGSSREHAVWALQDYGFRVIIAPAFADIFYNNCFKNGLLPVTLPEAAVATLLANSQERPDYQLTVDLDACLVTAGDGFQATFEIAPFRRWCLIHGLDDIALTLKLADKITAFEAQHGG